MWLHTCGMRGAKKTKSRKGEKKGLGRSPEQEKGKEKKRKGSKKERNSSISKHIELKKTRRCVFGDEKTKRSI